MEGARPIPASARPDVAAAPAAGARAGSPAPEPEAGAEREPPSPELCDPDGLAIPFAESPLLERHLARLAPEEAELVRRFSERGYLVFDPGIEGFDEIARGAIRKLAPRYPDDDRRVMDAWATVPEVREIARAPRVLELLALLYGRGTIPFQTLNFDRGTEQAAHSDTIHFHCVPHRFMCGVWVALEGTDAGNGPLFVHPGSHRLPVFEMSDLGLRASTEDYGRYEERVADILAERGYEREEVHVPKGHALVWAANLFHGGAPIRETGRTRHSQVTHYYFDDCLYYFPMGSEPFGGRVAVREVIDVGRGRFVTPRYRGRAVSLADYPLLWQYERPLPDWVEGAGGLVAEQEEEAEPESADVELLRRRIRNLEATVGHLRATSRRLHEENAQVHADNRLKDGYIEKRNGELPYKIARRVTKTWNAMLGRPSD